MDFVSQKVEEVIARFKTRDVFEIARAANVKIVYESWYPTTIGEFDRKNKIITVNSRALKENKNADKLEKIIIAHELGHFFALNLNLNKSEEEQFAREFAQGLIGEEK